MTKKRIVSAIYADYHPWDNLKDIVDCVASSSPADLRENDILIVHGGGDIHPSLYGKLNMGRSHVGDSPGRRDIIEWSMMKRAKELGVPVIGQCRGAQMLCALAGGFLIQHVTGHGGMHEITTNDGKKFMVNSIHHQMMQPQKTKHELVAWTTNKLSEEYWDEDKKVEVDIEPEFVYFNEINGFAFQWHPEAMALESNASKYIMKFVEDRIYGP